MNLVHTYRKASQFLLDLPDQDYEQLLPLLEFTSLPQHQVLIEVGEPIEYVYFPIDAVVSLLSVMENGSMVEVALAGSGSVVGLPMVLSADNSSLQAVVQVSGLAMRMEASHFRTEFYRSNALQKQILRCIQVFFVYITQSAACNRLHRLENRLARWLLTFQDHLGSDELPLTQEFISQMLGTRRAGVTMAINELRKDGILDCSRGRIKILNRDRLEATSCECYRRISAEIQRLESSESG